MYIQHFNKNDNRNGYDHVKLKSLNLIIVQLCDNMHMSLLCMK